MGQARTEQDRSEGGSRSASPDGRRTEERGRAETALRQLAAIQSVTDLALRDLRLEELAPEILERVRRSLEADSSTLLLTTTDGRALRVFATCGLGGAGADEASQLPAIPMGHGISGRIAATRAPMVVPEIGGADLGPALLREQVRSLVGVPLLSEDRVAGVLHVGSRTRREFSSEDVRLLELVAERVVRAIERARWIDALEATEERLRVALEATELGVWELDPVRRTLTWDRRCRELFLATEGDGADEPSLTFVLSRTHPEDRARAAGAFQRVLDPLHGGALSLDLRTTEARQERWVAVRGRAFFDDRGRPARVTGTFRDVTGRKRSEARLAAQSALARTLAEVEQTTDLLPRVLEALGPPLGWAVAEYWRFDTWPGLLRREACWFTPQPEIAAFEADSARREFAPGEGVPGRVWHTHAPLWLPDGLGETAGRRAALAAHTGVQAVCGVPVVSGGEALGVIVFFARGPRDRDEALLASLVDFGVQLGQFLLRTRAQEEVRRSEARKRAMLESALDAIFSTDARGILTEFNPAAERTFGWRRDEVIGKELASLLIPARMRESFRASLEPPRSSEPAPRGQVVDIPLLRKDGSEFPAVLGLSRTAGEGGGGFTAYAHDITQRQRAESEREALLEGLRAAVRLRDEFLSIASHELRTPLTALRLQLEGIDRVLRRGEGAQSLDRLAHKADMAVRQADRLGALIDGLLDVSRITIGRLQLDLEELDLTALVGDVVERFADEFKRSGTELRLHAPAPVAGRWDRQRLEQVVTNLLSNAVKYGPGKPVRVEVSRQGDEAMLVVTDEGIGIAPEDLDRIFQRFERAVSVRHYGGLGLGLYICSQIVGAHGGRIQPRSRPGEGATFEVNLPLTTSTQDSVREDEQIG